MQIKLFIELRVNTQFICSGSYITYGSLARFLHDIAQITCKLNLACSRHNLSFHTENVSSAFSPRQTVYKTYLVFLLTADIFIFGRTQKVKQILGFNIHALDFALGNSAGTFSAYGSNRSFQTSDTGFSGIVADDCQDRRIRNSQHIAVYSVLFSLLRQEMPFGYLKFLLIGIACKLYYLHPV